MTTIAPALSRHQEDQLLLLLRFSALSRRGALDVYRAPDLNPGTMARLLRQGLTCSAAHKPAGGSQRTVYWLTDEGCGLAARLRDARAGVAKPDGAKPGIAKAGDAEP